MNLKEKYGSTALIAGGSEGIGAAFAHQLAQEGINLVIVARNEKKLAFIKQDILERHKVEVQTISCDLANEDAAKTIATDLGSKSIDILIYNAALSYIGKFEESSDAFDKQLAFVNMITPTSLTRLFGGEMLQRGKGAVVLMASMAGFQGSGYLASYAASKAHNRTFAESLWYEWKERGVDVMACCAGATSTPNYINTNPKKTSRFAPKVQSPEEVVQECLHKIGTAPSIITGGGNRMASFFMQRIMPRKTAITTMGDTTKKMYGV